MFVSVLARRVMGVPLNSNAALLRLLFSVFVVFPAFFPRRSFGWSESPNDVAKNTLYGLLIHEYGWNRGGSGSYNGGGRGMDYQARPRRGSAFGNPRTTSGERIRG